MKLEKGIVTLDIIELLDTLSDDQKVELIETLSCEEAVIKHVAEQILYGWTESGHCGESHGILNSDINKDCALNQARRRMVEQLDESSDKLIKSFEKSIKKTRRRFKGFYGEVYRVVA